MPVYQCRNCKKIVNLATRPGPCESCGNTQFKLTDQRQGKIAVYTGRTALTSLSGANTEPTASLPTEVELPSSLLASSVLDSLTGETIVTRKTTPKPLKTHKLNLDILKNKWLLLLVSGMGGLLFYVYWESQFNISTLKDVILQEKFQKPKAWYFTDGAIVQQKKLYQFQYKRNHYGASLWTGQKLANLDLSADVVKTQGPDNVPYGLIARVSGENAENFYYLFIDGSGEYIMGKNTAQGWVHKVGWQAHSRINRGKKTNRLRLVIKDDLIVGYINGSRVGSFRDDTYKAGALGLFSMRGKGKSTTVYFDNVIVKSDQKRK
ncbi:MAG: hypothetical protein N5P05_003280 [Chroococcopsis gigantea SAG 12.99]|jgi:hypothetical protein|nr:hypothetical protein [Chlorogloea purpurea SAG 13.99]MDV3001674.1 hypothetical protein [Chroococcopsis gigantea SAG 12.99]